jgi:two-component system CheB/CheR fusion protein
MTGSAEQPAFERILEYLRTSRGFDFTAYKPTSLLRRLQKRMQSVDVTEFDDYLDYLQVHPDEFGALFNTILINVTSFFRDPSVWDGLRTDILPELVASPRGIRVWSAGSASGQEAYTVAMLLAEAMDGEGFRERVKIYATDVDEEALAEARRAIYTSRQIADVPADLAAKYFERSGGDLYTVSRELRRSVIFGRHDLIQDAPISRVDLLLCRNTLMYFNSEAQARIMSRFAFSVSQDGYLVLGRAEMLFSQSTIFQPVDLKNRIFKTTAKASQRERLSVAQSGREDIVPEETNHGHLRDAAFEMSPGAQIVLDPRGVLVAANAAARRQFTLTQIHLGSPLHELQLSYRPTELRTLIDRAKGDRREIVQRAVPWDDGGVMRFLDVQVVPLYDHGRGDLLGLRINFTDVTTLRTLQDELTQSKQELETAYEELQSTNEELETTNEELQSTVEELETTNEELQSTNEELETMNEELQSTNEELQTMNDELRNRSLELNSSNAYLESVFTSLRSAVVVLDRDLQVHVWNAGALDMWGVRPEEAQRNSLFNLDIGLPVGELHQPIREILSGATPHREVTLPATNRRGKSINCHVSVAPLLGLDRTVTGVILLMEDHAAAN